MSLCVALVCIASLSAALPAHAQGKQDTDQSVLLQKMKYDVYTSGVHAVEADMSVDYTKPGRYAMVFNAATRGLLASFVPWTGSFAAYGWAFHDGRRLPELHESVSKWKDEEEVKSYHYGKDGSFKNIVTKITHKKDKTEVPDKALTAGTIDVLTATMKVMEKVSEGGKCEGRDEIFDGLRRYALVFRHQRFVMLQKSRYNAYSGPAAECTVEVVPVAGPWHKKPRGWLSIQEQGRARGMMPTVWIAQVKAGAVAVPVRVRVKTAYGTMFMHMTHYQSGDTVLSVE